ncbi:hypothetical protein [Candidatus Regiella insecticola]|uniref:TcdA/TcdB toxin pore forming domain-containing protein n=1 Tax=Candidatus Regiella insecticola TaxID=138073 RepID=A0A6L2ZMP9_9ENTR|nr:hypothetical protein [Candidatus Regiella insecticola]GFN45575.1 hypothetical protein RINTU1_08080 [Candidatus Regiella insecticola]
MPQDALQAFRTTLTSDPDSHIQVLFVGEKSLFSSTPEDTSSTEKWNGQSLAETREKISDLITQHLTGLRAENIQVILGQISVITDLDENNQPLPLRTEVTVDYLAPLRTSAGNIHVDPLLPQSPHRIPPTTGLPGGQAEHSDAIKLIQLIERQTLPPPSPEVRIQPPAVTSADKTLLLTMAAVQKKIHLQALARHVTAVIEQMTQQLNNNVEKIRYRFKKFVTTTESETELLFVQVRPTAQQNQQPAPLEKRLTSDNAVFVTMRDKMTALEPEIAHVDGVSTLNVAFLAMHLLARQHDDETSAWRKFVTIANLTQILHGIGQDMGRLANTIKIVNGAGAKAEGILGKLMGGAAYTHAGSVVNVAVDIINLIDAIEALKQMPASPQKDFATTRVVLASTQLAVDSTLTVLGTAASFSPAIANGMAIAAPLSVPFVGVMIGANALVTAVASNNAHYQVELDQIIAPFRHILSKTTLQPREILQPDLEHPQLMYFEPYVPIKKIVINGENVSVQVADIRVPQFEDKALGKHTSDYHRALSAYSAFGFDVTTPCEQAVRLQPSSILALPAALNGHYQFIHDTGAYGRLDGKAIFNQFHQYHDALFPFTIEGVNAPNNVRFHPHPTRQVIALDAGVRYITFQTIQQVNRIPGQHHDGLSAGQLPTPLTDAAHAHYLTYQFEGAGGTTFIDLPDDARQIIIAPSSDRLKRLSESWVLDITPDMAISNREARIALQQAHIERLALHHSGEEWALTLANSTVKITQPTLENIRLQLRPIELPGVTFNLTLLGNRPATPQFHLSLAVESIATLSDDNLSNIKSIMQRYFSDSRRFSFNPPLRLDIQLERGHVATGLLDLTSGRWQAIHNDGSTTAHPHLYTSEGQRVALLARPNARITGVAHIEYDHAQQQFYVAGIAKPRDHLNNTLSYHYYPHLPEKARYQKIEIAHLDEENSEENGWQVRSLEPLLDEIHAQSPQEVIPIHLPTTGLRAEYAWDGERKFFKKMAWEQDEHQFIAECHDSETLPILTVIALPSATPAPLTVSKLGADFLSKYQNALSALTLVVQDNTPKVDLLDFPLIPLKVFAHLDTKIVGAREGTTLFLHSRAVPNITFKLTAQQHVPGESALKWGVSLYAENQQALQGESRAKIVHILQNHKNNSLSWDIGLSIPLSIGDSQGGQTDGMFDVAAPLISKATASKAKGINKTPDDTAHLGQAISAFHEGNDERLSQNRHDSVLAFYAGAAGNLATLA